MKVLIVENELYLAQSIMSKLENIGFICQICSSINDALSKEEVDVVLLSTNMSGQNFYPVIEKYKSKIVILMVSYVTHDSVGSPIEAGAKDYILKPFMIDELVRKIKMFEEFEKRSIDRDSKSEYIKKQFDDIEPIAYDKKLQFPLLLESNVQRAADAFAFRLIESKNKPVYLVDLSKEGWKKKSENFNKELSMMYAICFEKLKPMEKKEFLNIIASKDVIFSSLECESEFPNKIVLSVQKNSISRDEILSVDEYLKAVISQYQDKYPDTELSKKLGMSRKSLWEKRKKYGVEKKK